MSRRTDDPAEPWLVRDVHRLSTIALVTVAGMLLALGVVLGVVLVTLLGLATNPDHPAGVATYPDGVPTRCTSGGSAVTDGDAHPCKSQQAPRPPGTV